MKLAKLALLLLALPAILPAQHTYWRLITTSTSSSFAMVGQWTSFDSGSSTISTAGGTSSTSSGAFGAASNAFNGTTNCSTFWQAGNNGLTGEWLEYQFASPVSIDHFDLIYGCNGGYGLVDFSLQFSDNNSTWTTLYTYNGVSSGGVAPSTQSFSASNAVPTSPAVWWRLSFNLTSGCAGMSSLLFYTGANATGSTINMAAFAALATTFGPGTAADLAISTPGQAWGSGGSGTRTENWTYAFSTPVSPGSIQFSNANIGGCTQVNNLATSYSLDNVSYTTTDTFTPTWSGTQTKTFNVTGGPVVPSTSQAGAFLVGP